MYLFTIFCFIAFETKILAASDLSQSIFSKSNGLFSSKFYNYLQVDEREELNNILISPVSLNFALTALSLGASGLTLVELHHEQSQPDNETAIVESYRSFSESIKNDKHLNTVTKIFVSNTYPLKQKFINTIRNFGADIQNLNISDDPEGSRETINKFVDNKTNHRIPDLLVKGDIDSSTQSVIVNAIHFIANWTKPFDKNRTEKKTFYAFKGESKVDMMQRTNVYHNYFEDKEIKAQLLELPYKDGYSFLVILPFEREGITEVENKIKSSTNASPFIDIFKQTKEELLDVYLPKFTFSKTYHLEEHLKQDMFSVFYNSNYSRMSDVPFSVTNVIQKTFISVQESGTEAAAATAIINLQGGIFSVHDEPIPKIFNADHPFLFVIKHESSGTPLFLGRYGNE